MLTLGLVCAKISAGAGYAIRLRGRDRKSTRLNSSHSQISYAVFCLKKKKKLLERNIIRRNQTHSHNCDAVVCCIRISKNRQSGSLLPDDARCDHEVTLCLRAPMAAPRC